MRGSATKRSMLLPRDDSSLYAALLARDPAYDGFFFVGVRSTGILCRLTCPARKPKRANVVFFSRTAEALAAGFRPWLRCRPLEMHAAAGRALETVRTLIGAEPHRRWSGAELAALGYDASTIRRAFKHRYGVTFAQYVRARRLGRGVSRLQAGDAVLEAQLESGYESGSGFREAIGRLLGEAPVRTKSRRILDARWLDTPIGAMLAVADEAGVHLLEFADRRALPAELERLQRRVGPVCFGEGPLLAALAEQLAGYFAGRLTRFDVPLAQQGTPFERSVWAALQQVPCGETRSYSQLARALGRPAAVRAVARANGANQIAIVVPCHRVIGVGGALVGYGGKLWRKQWLLEHERRLSPEQIESRSR